jgi:pilus assembly protein CpaE
MLGLSFVIASGSRKFVNALEQSADIEILARVQHLHDLVRIVDEKRPDALLVSLESHPDAVFKTLEKLLSPRPVLFFHGPDDSRLILQAMRSGGSEYIAPAPDEERELLAAIRRAAPEIASAKPVKQSSLISLIGAKGGVGTSFTACQLAAALARQGGRTALVDGHLRHGDVALYLDLSPKYDFASLAAGDNPIDATYLHTALAPHSSGVAVLAAPKLGDDVETVSSKCIAQVLDLLGMEFDWVIWDTPRDFDDRSLRVLDQSGAIVLVTTPDVPALNHTRMQLELLARLGHRQEKIRIVVNRSETRAAVSGRDAKGFLKRPVDATIPNDYARASACVNEGRALYDVAPRSGLERAFSGLALAAHTWCGHSTPAPAQKRGLLGRLRGR